MRLLVFLGVFTVIILFSLPYCCGLSRNDPRVDSKSLTYNGVFHIFTLYRLNKKVLAAV